MPVSKGKAHLRLGKGPNTVTLTWVHDSKEMESLQEKH